MVPQRVRFKGDAPVSSKGTLGPALFFVSSIPLGLAVLIGAMWYFNGREVEHVAVVTDNFVNIDDFAVVTYVYIPIDLDGRKCTAQAILPDGSCGSDDFMVLVDPSGSYSNGGNSLVKPVLKFKTRGVPDKESEIVHARKVLLYVGSVGEAHAWENAIHALCEKKRQCNKIREELEKGIKVESQSR